MKNTLKFALLILSLSTFISGQEKKQETPPVDEDIIRVSSELVLVDSIVLDKNGRQVTDLTADDFEVYQDGKLQEITNFAYVNPTNSLTDLAQTKNKAGKKSLPTPPISVRSNQGRVITFVIDDGNCKSTPETMATARDAVKKFIAEQMLPDDKVGIYRTRGGTSLLQAYTSNKEVLRRLANKINWYPSLICESYVELSKTGNAADPSRNNDGIIRSDKNVSEQVFGTDEERRVTSASIGVISFAVDRLKNVPGRKTVFLISDGIGIGYGELETVSDKAIRSSVVIYTLSSRGVTNPAMSFADSGDSATDKTGDNISDEFIAGAGMEYLADTTGGKFIRNKNFLDVEVGKVLASESGYYLLGYQPDGETFKGKEFHKIEVKLKRGDLQITSRKGFYGREDIKTARKPKTEESPLYGAIASPFSENGMDIRMTTLVGHDEKQGNYVRALFHVKGEDLTFIDQPNGAKKVSLDVVVVTLDEKGKVAGEFNRTYPIVIPKQGVQIVMANGLDYSADLPVKKPGFYSFRLAVRDGNSKRLGSANDFVEVPDAKKGKFFISGLFTTMVTNDSKPLIPKNRPVDGAFAPVFFNSIPSIRQYEAGSVLSYVYDIYNPKLDAANKQPNLTKQIRLYKDGKLLADVPEKPLEIKPQNNMQYFQTYDFLRLNENAETGEYMLQVIIRDKLANKTESQWIDFEVVK